MTKHKSLVMVEVTFEPIRNYYIIEHEEDENAVDIGIQRARDERYTLDPEGVTLYDINDMTQSGWTDEDAIHYADGDDEWFELKDAVKEIEDEK